MPSPYDRIRRRVQRRQPPRRPPPPSTLSIISQLFQHMFSWIDVVQMSQEALRFALQSNQEALRTNQEALSEAIGQLQGQMRGRQVELHNDMSQIWHHIDRIEERMEEDNLFPAGRYSRTSSSGSSAATEATWRCPNSQVATVSNVEIAGPSTSGSSSSSTSVYTMVCSCGCGQSLSGPSTSNATASVTAATAQMCMYDMDSQQNVMVPWRESDATRLSVMGTLASLPPLFPPTPSLMLPPPPPPPQIPPPPPPPARGIEVEADPLVYENPENHLHYEDPEDNPRWRPVFLSDLPFEDEYPDAIAPQLRRGRCQICLEEQSPATPTVQVLWRPNCCGHLQICDDCMHAGPGVSRVNIREGNTLTHNETVRQQFTYLHHQRQARRSVGALCISSGCDDALCDHWQLFVDFQQRGLECEVCRQVFSGYIREVAEPPSTPPPAQPNA